MRSSCRPRVSSIRNRVMNQRNRPAIQSMTPMASYVPEKITTRPRKSDIDNVNELLEFNNKNTQKSRVDKLVNELTYNIEKAQKRWLTIVNKIACDFVNERKIEGKHKKYFSIQDRLAVAIVLEKKYRGIIRC